MLTYVANKLLFNIYVISFCYHAIEILPQLYSLVRYVVNFFLLPIKLSYIFCVKLTHDTKAFLDA
jgi:hypothetical protein